MALIYFPQIALKSDIDGIPARRACGCRGTMLAHAYQFHTHMPRVQRRARRAGRALGRSRAARVPALFAAEEDAWLECRIKWRDCSDRPIARRPASTSCIPVDPLVQGICDVAVLVMLGAGSLAGQLPQAASPQPPCSDDSRYMHWLGLCGVARRPASTSCIPAVPLFRGLAT